MGIGSNVIGQLGLGRSSLTYSFIQIPILNNLNNILFNRTKFIDESSYFIQTYEEMNNSPLMNNSKLIEEIVIPIILFVLILSILFILLFLYLKRKTSFKRSSEKLPDDPIELKELIKSGVEINLNELIEGSNRIYKGKYTGKEVALKKVEMNENSILFINEVHIFK